ncbi:MAG: ATP-binding protein [Oscillospiraceae bacterium]|nr:ATP-binding protein [Oscillospiraceae bacterium]
MSYDANVFRRAVQRLAEERTQREELQRRRQEEIFKKIPRAAEIDRQLRRTIIELIRSALSRGSDPVAALQTVRDKNLGLQAEQAELLAAHGYPIDALNSRPACPRCGDTGWVGSEMCRCLEALCAQEQIKELSKLLDLGGQTFDLFSLDYYSDQPWTGETVPPRENMEFIRDVCWSYAERFGVFPVKNLFLTGSPGLGKTFLSACIARVVSEKGHSVVYDTAVQIFNTFEAQKFSRDAEDTQQAQKETHQYLRCDLLILDDLGSEMTTPFVQSALYTLINTRLTAGRHTVISSNLSMDEVRRRYAGQVASRLEGEYRPLCFYGEDVRQLRKLAPV